MKSELYISDDGKQVRLIAETDCDCRVVDALMAHAGPISVNAERGNAYISLELKPSPKTPASSDDAIPDNCEDCGQPLGELVHLARRDGAAVAVCCDCVLNHCSQCGEPFEGGNWNTGLERMCLRCKNARFPKESGSLPPAGEPLKSATDIPHAAVKDIVIPDCRCVACGRQIHRDETASFCQPCQGPVCLICHHDHMQGHRGDPGPASKDPC